MASIHQYYHKVSRVMRPGKYPFSFAGTPKRARKKQDLSESPVEDCSPPPNQQRLFDQQPPACAVEIRVFVPSQCGISYSWLQSIRYDCLFLKIQISWWLGDQWLEVCVMGHIYTSTCASFHLQGRRSTSSPPGEVGQLYLGSRGWWMGKYKHLEVSNHDEFLDTGKINLPLK